MGEYILESKHIRHIWYPLSLGIPKTRPPRFTAETPQPLWQRDLSLRWRSTTKQPREEMQTSEVLDAHFGPEKAQGPPVIHWWNCWNIGGWDVTLW